VRGEREHNTVVDQPEDAPLVVNAIATAIGKYAVTVSADERARLIGDCSKVAAKVELDCIGSRGNYSSGIYYEILGYISVYAVILIERRVYSR